MIGQKRKLNHFITRRIHQTILVTLAGLAMLLSPLAWADTLHVADDAHIDLGNPADNTGNVPNLEVSNIVTRKSGEKQTYIAYDLIPLPDGANLEQAFLRLFVGKVQTEGMVDLYLVTESWDEDSIDGNNDPAIEPSPFTGFNVTFSDEGHFVLIDVTPEVQAWLDSTANNYGFALVGNPTADVEVSFDSKENSQSSHSSELEVIVADVSAATECGSDEFFDGDGLCVASADIGTNTNAETNCADDEYLNGDGTCVASADIGTDTNAETECADGEYFNGDGSCVASADIGTNTNAETNCADNEYLNGDGTCVASADIGTDTNAETNCADGEYLNGDGSCVASADIGTNTNAETNCAAGQYLNGDGGCYAVPVDSDTNTNAATICAAGEYLNGDGACYPVPVDTDTNTNAATICAAGEYLNGDGACYPVPVNSDTNTNAETICAAGFFLDGDGTCRSAISDWVIITAEKTTPGGEGAGLSAECPDGYVVMGGGYILELNGVIPSHRTTNIEIVGAFPTSRAIGPNGPVGWQYRIWYNNHGADPERVRVKATCAKSDW